MNTFLGDILDQPKVLAMVLASMLKEDRFSIDKAAEAIASAERVVLTSMGSAFYSLAPMAYSLVRLHHNVHLVETGELMRMPFFPGTLYLIMSRSGESKEIVEYSTTLRERGEQLLAITMTPGSGLAKNATFVIHDPAGYDGFICTKAYTSLALIGLLIASSVENTLNERLSASLQATFDWMEGNKQSMLAKIQQAGWLGNSLTFLSRGAGLGLAQAGALWLEEAARVRASYSSIDFFLHGPVEQVDQHFMGVWIDLFPDELSRKLYQKVFAKGGRWIAVGSEAYGGGAITIPDFDLPEAYRIIPAAIPVQLIAYQSAINQGLEAGDMRYLSWVVK